MQRRSSVAILSCCLVAALTCPSWSANIFNLEEGAADMHHAGPLAFGPQGVLFVGDAKSGKVFAVATGDDEATEGGTIQIDDLAATLAEAVGGSADAITINDMAVNPLSGNAYFSIDHNGAPGIVRVDASGDTGAIPLDNVWFASIALEDVPEDKEVARGRRRRNPRNDAITDLAFVEGQVIVSGLTSRESASGVRSIPFPFGDEQATSSLEIFHAAHGRSEDYAAIRTFVPFVVDGQPNLLAGFVCTPLVRFPLGQVTRDASITGTTVAELGNRNRPLDMFVYEKDGAAYLLLSNSARGVMKISTDSIEEQQITDRVGGGGTAGQTYKTIESWTNVVQMDRLNDSHALVLQDNSGTLVLRSVPLP